MNASRLACCILTASLLAPIGIAAARSSDGLKLQPRAAQPAGAANAPHSTWRAATEAETSALIPDRAPVEKERIETELRTASAITNGHGKFVAGVVLITAGYSADGKYSHFFLTQVPIQIGDFKLPPGEYVFGWHRKEDSLDVQFYSAASGTPVGKVEARRMATGRVESFRILPPADKSLIQIGRFAFPYEIVE